MRIIGLVYRKEIRDMFRDKRVRYSAFMGPLFGIALLVMILSFVTTALKPSEGEKLYVIRSGAPLPATMKDAKFDIVEVPSVAEAMRMIKDGRAKLVLDFGHPGPDGSVEIDAYEDPKEQRAQLTLSAVEHAFAEINKERLKSLLASKGLPPNADEAFKVVHKDVQVGEKGGAGEFLTGFLPYLVVIWAFFGGMSISSDLVAGEKEKNTLETLLISPAERTQIVLGKFFALATVCLSSSVTSVVGLAVFAALKIPGTEAVFKNGFGVTMSAFLITLSVLIPLVAFFASLLIAVSSFARNSREAQTYLSQFSFIVIIPAVFSQFIGLTDAGQQMWINFIPILNAANCIRTALLGKSDPVSVLITVAVSLIIALAALRLTVFLFNREEVLVRV